jgi:hypothetical protein
MTKCQRIVYRIFKGILIVILSPILLFLSLGYIFIDEMLQLLKWLYGVED